MAVSGASATGPGTGEAVPTVVRSLDLRAASSLAIAEQIEQGLSYERLEMLQQALELTGEEAASAIGVSPRTLSRRKDRGVLTPEESDRLIQLAILFDEAVSLFEHEVEPARDWFKRPNRGLGGKTPLEAVGTYVGAREVERLIGRLEHGVFA